MILITGGSSFLGHHVKKEFQSLKYSAPTSKELNLLSPISVRNYFTTFKPKIIVHMAALCGGIGANKKRPADFMHQNIIMTSNLFEAVRVLLKPEETYFYGLGSVCAYACNTPVPFKEEDIWNGYPEPTNAGYGIYKRTMLLMQQVYRQQYGLKGAHLIPVNLMGEHDHFNLQNSHVIPALIRKFLEAKEQNKPVVEIWGDGTPTREFLYAGDCAKAIFRAVSTSFDYPEPINLGTGQDISIFDLAYKIKEIVGYSGDIQFNGEKDLNGQPKRQLDVSRAKNVLGFTAGTNLNDALKLTLDWYESNRE